MYSALDNLNEEHPESSDFPSAVYKTAVMAGDIILKKELLLNHRHVLSLIANRRKQRGRRALSDHVTVGDDAFDQEDTDYIWSLYKERYDTPEKAQAVLQQISQHQSLLAFHEIDFGGDSTGINGCTPTDVMHSMKLGLLRYVSKWLMDLIKPAQKAIIDELAHSVLRQQRQTENRYYPRTNFSHSVTGVSMLTADEWVGVLFSMVVLLQTTKGENAFRTSKPSLPPNTDLDAVINMIEMLLSFMTWLSVGPFWSATDPSSSDSARHSIEVFITNLVEQTPRHEGNGWCIIKLHDLRHICGHISKFGAPMNWDSSTGERNLKEHAKKPAKTAQMRGYKTFLEQTMKRTVERQAIQMATEDWRVKRWDDWNEVADEVNKPNNNGVPCLRKVKSVVRTHDNGLVDTASIIIFQLTLIVNVSTGMSQTVNASQVGSNRHAPPGAIMDAIVEHITSEMKRLHENDLPCERQR